MGIGFKMAVRSGLKRGLCGLICCMMVAVAALLPNVFSLKASAAGEKNIDVHLNGDFKKVRENMNKALSDACLKEASVINIILDSDISINPDSSLSKIVGMGNGYLFDFTSGKFKNKIINIKSKDKNVFKVKNKNENVGFLKAKGCTVSLENIEVSGGAVYKEYKIPCTKVKIDDKCVSLNRNFINISDDCVLNLNNKSSIKDVYITSDEYHVIYLNDSQLNMNGGCVSGCRIESEYGCPSGGAVCADNQSSVILDSGGYITKCSVFQAGLSRGGAVCLDNGSMLHMKGGSHIDNCCAVGDYAVGGAISAEHKSTVIMEKDSCVDKCSMLGNNSCGGGLFVDVESCLDLRGGRVSDCKAVKYGDAVYFAGGGEFKLASPGGALKITLRQGLDNSHNSDVDVLGYCGIYKYGVPAKADVKDIAFYKVPVEFSFKTELVIDKKLADKLMIDFINKDMKDVDFSSVKWKYTDVNGQVKEISKTTKVGDFAAKPKEEVKTDKVEEVKTDKVEEVKTDKVEEVKTDKVEEVKTDKVEEVKTDKVEEVKTDKVEEVKTDKVEEVKTDKVEEVKTDKVEEVKTDKVEEVKTDKVEEVKTDKVEEVKTDKVEEVKTDKVEEVKTDKVEEVKTDKVEEVKTDKVEEVKTDKVEEVKTDKVEEVKTDKVEEVKTDKVEEVKTDKVEEVKTDKVEEVKTDNQK